MCERSPEHFENLIIYSRAILCQNGSLTPQQSPKQYRFRQIIYWIYDDLWRRVDRLYLVIIKLQSQMSLKNTSLMERRKINFEALKTTIKSLSVVERQLKAPIRPTLHQYHSTGELELQSHNTPSETLNPIDSSTDLRPKDSFNTFSSQQDNHDNEFEERYKAEQKLGEGAHGVVRRCVNKISGKAHAVKILQTEDEHFTSLRTNFINIRQLKHQSVIEYKALYINPKQRVCQIIMEYFPYPHLQPGLTEDQLRKTFYKIFDALSYLHQKHICHRDIKPENILYDRTTGNIKIIDFGVSKNLKMRGRYEEMLTNTGTYYYKAPQMFLGGGYTQAVDNWAAGITLYEMATGTTPFASVYHSETINNILTKQIDFKREQFLRYNPLLRNLISQLLNRNPKQRISSQQAKKHLWFYSNISENEMLKSAGYHKNTQKQGNKKELASFVMKRKASLLEEQARTQQEVTKNDRKVMKTWLQIINEDTPSYHTEKVSIDFVESQDEDDFGFRLPSEIQPSDSEVKKSDKKTGHRTISN